MPQIWYNSDEVSIFQPAVELALNNALVACGYDGIAEVVHNPNIPNSSTIPDCVLPLQCRHSHKLSMHCLRLIQL